MTLMPMLVMSLTAYAKAKLNGYMEAARCI